MRRIFGKRKIKEIGESDNPSQSTLTGSAMKSETPFIWYVDFTNKIIHWRGRNAARLCDIDVYNKTKEGWNALHLVFSRCYQKENFVEVTQLLLDSRNLGQLQEQRWMERFSQRLPVEREDAEPWTTFDSTQKHTKQVTFDSLLLRDVVQCYNCGNLGHISRDCPLPYPRWPKSLTAAGNGNSGLTEQGREWMWSSPW
jgi:hypothetical protein